jgi:hypothetical protein
MAGWHQAAGSRGIPVHRLSKTQLCDRSVRPQTQSLRLCNPPLPHARCAAAGPSCLQVVANSRCSETFVALCLLTVCGAALATSRLGLSESLGAFLAGVLLSETSYRTQVRRAGQGRVRAEQRAVGAGHKHTAVT